MTGLGDSADYWNLKRNTQVKHDILSEYLQRWMATLSGRDPHEERTFHYVDGFAGRGSYSRGEPGSPIIAMRIGQELHDFRGGRVFLRCYNVEQKRDNFESLEREVEANRSRYRSVRVKNDCGAFQKHSANILKCIPPGENTFVFIDPFGYRGVELAQVLKFLERRRSEVFTTFMSNYIGQYLTDQNRAAAMDAIFDTKEWRRIAESPTGSQQAAVVELYGKQLQKRALERGKELYVLPINVQFEERAADIYHLIHASQHPKARLEMELAVRKAKRLSTQETMFSMAPEIEQDVLDALRASSDGMRVLSLAGKVWHARWYASWNDIKEAIRSLEATGEAEVRTHNGRARPRGGLEEKDLVLSKGGGR